MESDQSHTLSYPAFPSEGPFITWYGVTFLSLLLLHEVHITPVTLALLNMRLHRGVHLPLPLSVRYLQQSPVALSSLPSDLCSNVTSWKKPLTTHSLPLSPSSSPNAVPLFFKASAVILNTCLPISHLSH